MLESEMNEISRYVNGDRLWNRLMALASFGALPGGGVNRQALSAEEIAARAEIVRWGRAIGLEPSTDPVANLFLRLQGREAGLPPLLVGTHIDSQPTGGKFDGAYGVMAALEVAEAIVASGCTPRRSIDVVAWMNEEGSRFAPGMMGSAVYSGARSLEDILSVTDSSGISVESARNLMFASENGIPVREICVPPFSFLEAHIEQGPILEAEKTTIGIVTGIQGKRTFRVLVKGEENHAGTSPRSTRRDALVSAVSIVTALQHRLWDADDTVRLTVGMFTVSPNAPSVVPGKVVFSIDLRHPDADALTRIGDTIYSICTEHRLRCDVEVEELLHDPPLEFVSELRVRLSKIANKLNISNISIASGAGHDARYLNRICPTAMIFIPCRGGISHNKAESITKADALAGAHVLAEAVAALANDE
jgi:N-carbamoyl-L-amino-acid hydrolase